MPFGKYKGWEIGDIPVEYLEWLIDNVELKGGLAAEVRDMLEMARPVDGLVVSSIYRRLAMKWHPDKGGNTEAMAAINEFYAEIKAAIVQSEG